MNEWPMFQDGGADVLALENAIFETALAIEEAETRDRFLKRVYHDDPEGLGRMEDLLSLTGESAMFFIESQRLRADLADEVIREMPEGDLPAMNRVRGWTATWWCARSARAAAGWCTKRSRKGWSGRWR